MPVPIETSAGTFLAYYSERGLARLNFPGSSEQSHVSSPSEFSPQVRQWHAVTTKALESVLAGREPKAFPPFDLSTGTEFQQRVWNAMLRIAPGQTKSYA